MKKGIICIFSSFIFVFIVVIASHVAAYTISHFSPSEYLPKDLATMEINLGISGAEIEDFDDANLCPGLTVSGPTYSGVNDWADSRV